jgi:hypothetical protein
LFRHKEKAAKYRNSLIFPYLIYGRPEVEYRFPIAPTKKDIKGKVEGDFFFNFQRNADEGMSIGKSFTSYIYI